MVCILLAVLCCSSSATDYVYVSVNGDTSAASIVSGDTLAFGCNLTGRGVWWEILIDADHSGEASPQDKFLVGFRQVDQDYWSAFGIGDGDSAMGWVRFEVGPAGLVPGQTYIALATDEDGSSGFDTLAVNPLPAPAGIISGTISVEGLVGPDSGLAMIEVEAGRDTIGGFWTALTDTNGDYTIEVDSSGLGLVYQIGPTAEIYPYMTPDQDTMTLVDTLSNMDFLYELAAATVIGSVVDETGDSLPRGIGMDASSESMGSRSSTLHESGRYFFSFNDTDMGDWAVGLSGYGLFPFYLAPPSKNVTIAPGDTVVADFIVYRADTVIPGIVTILDTVPLDTFHFILAECETAGVGLTIAACDSVTGTYELGVNGSDTLTWRVAIDPPGGDRLPGFVVEDGFGRMGVHAGDSVNFNFVPATDTIGGQVSFHASVPGSLQFPLDSVTIFGVYWTTPLFPFKNVAGFAKPDPSGFYQIAAEPDTFALFCTDFPDTNYFAVPFYYDSLIIAGGADTLDFVIYHNSVGVNESRESLSAARTPRLDGCRPNPFTRSTFVRAEIPEKNSEEGAIRIYDASGRIVRVLCSGGSGVLSFTWEGKDDMGRYLPGGVYFIRLELPNLRMTRKAVLIR
jgi:hypothetical protein